MKDLNQIEIFIFLPLILLTLFFGLYPEPLFNTINTSVNNLIYNYNLNLNFHLNLLNN